MRALPFATGGLFLLALVVAGCGGHGGAVPPTTAGPASLFADQATEVGTTTKPWCGDMPYADTNTVTVICILDAGKEASWTTKVPVDEQDSAGAGDTCGSVVWGASPNPTVSVGVQDTTPPGSCSQHAVRVTVLRIADQPQPSPSPGALIMNYLVPGTDVESGENGENTQTGSGQVLQMPGPGTPIAGLQFTVLVYAPPALQISDSDTSGNPAINSPLPSASPLMVGQQIDLIARAAGGQFTDSTGTVAGTVTWAVASPDVTNVVASYAACSCPSVASPEPLGPGGESLTVSPSPNSVGPNQITTPLTLYFVRSGSEVVPISGGTLRSSVA